MFVEAYCEVKSTPNRSRPINPINQTTIVYTLSVAFYHLRSYRDATICLQQ